MAKKYAIYLTGAIASIALIALTLLLTAPSWSSSSRLFVSRAAPETLPPPGSNITLSGSGFSPTTSLWLVPERSLRSATTATLETYGNPTHFICRNDRLYVANGTGGFFIVQGLQSSAPAISGIVNGGGQGMEIVLRRDEALMAAGTGGLQIIDIRDETNPQLLSTLKTVAPALSVASTGNIAYIAAGKAGVQIVDVTDPRKPQHLGKLANLPEAYTYKLLCDEKILIIATRSGGWLYDISHPEEPRRLATLPVPGGSNTVMARQGEILYWATKISDESRLYAMDLSNPISPRLLTHTLLGGTPYGISYSEGQLAIALGCHGTQLFSLDVGSQLAAKTATVAPKIRAHYALLLGDDLWVADSAELLRLDQKKANALTALPILPDFSHKIQPIVTSQLFILGDETGLSIYARADDAAPIRIARLPITGLVQQYLSTDQRQLWLAIQHDAPATTGKLISVDISLPFDPRITSETPLANPPVIIGEYGTTLIISTPARNLPRSITSVDALHSLQFIDISRPQNPTFISTYHLGNVGTGYCLTDNLFVAMQLDGLLQVIDVGAADGPQEVGSLQMPWLQTAAWLGRVNIVVKDKLAFISSSLGEVFLIDLHDPGNLKNLGVLTLTGPVVSLLINDYYLLAEINKQGLVVINLENLAAPEILGTIPLPGLYHSPIVQNGTLWYINIETSGIWSLPLPRRLQSSVTGDQLSARLAAQPPPGAYRFWLNDAQNHLLVPGVTWSRPR